MIEFTKFDATTGEILAWHQTTHVDQVAAQLALGEAAAFGRLEEPFSEGEALYRAPDGEFYLIDKLVTLE